MSSLGDTVSAKSREDRLGEAEAFTLKEKDDS